jgi:hypothetical protein
MALGATVSAGMLVRGYVRYTSFPGTNGDKLYLSETAAGQMTATMPSSTANIVRIVAYNIDSTNKIIYFNPDNTYIELA